MDFMTRLRLHGKGKDGFDGCVVLGSSPRFSAAGRLGLQGGCSLWQGRLPTSNSAQAG
jgi:hypothetical protein